MFGFILGAIAGAAGMWAYNKWFGEPEDDDWDTGAWEQPSTSSYPSTGTSAPASEEAAPSGTGSTSTSSETGGAAKS